MSRIPSINGLDSELQRVKRGYGLNTRSFEKLLACPHLQRALGVRNGGAPLDRAFEIRKALTKFIENNDRISSTHKTALVTILNLDADQDYYELKLGGRQASLETVLKVGSRRRASEEAAAIRALAEQLLRYGQGGR